MFWKKEQKENPLEPEKLVSVQTIPADFYGGVNPVVKFKRVEKEVIIEEKKPVASPVLTPPEKKMLEKITSAGAGKPLHPANIFSNKKYLIIFASAVFILFVVGASAYYIMQNRKNRQVVIQTPKQEQKKEEPAEEKKDEPIVVPTTTEEIPTETVVPNKAVMEFPSMLLADTTDFDGDDISDTAEELFKSDPGAPDSDSDKYSDGHEVYNLYNPAGFEPIKLIDSGLVKEFENPKYGYKLYYPASWAMGSVDADYVDVLFSTITGENIEVQVFEKEAGQSFDDWFAKNAAGQKIEDLISFETRFEENGQRRSDFLVYYFTDDKNVYVLAYHTTDSNSVNYRMILKMMARSFRL